MTYLDVRGAARTDHLVTEATLYFGRPLTNEEMGVLRERVETAMNPKPRKRKRTEHKD